MANSWKQELFYQSPWPIKEILVMAEAMQRNRLRRYGHYDQVKQEYAFEHYRRPETEIQQQQLAKLQNLLAEAYTNCEFYCTRFPQAIDRLEDLAQIPILTKSEIREHRLDMISRTYNHKHLWTTASSGSTGTPLKFSVGREGVRVRTAILDNFYEMFDCYYGEQRVRLGGSRIAPASSSRPPFWIQNRVDNQLQMSVYHIDKQTLPLYIQAINTYRPKYITGYAHSMYVMGQYLCEHGGLETPIQAVFLDSEGIPAHYAAIIEQGFRSQVCEQYGLGEVGTVAVHCTQHRYHILELSSVLEIVDEQGMPVPDGQMGRIVVTDLTQTAVPYIRYDTGDVGRLSAERCSCGLNTRILEAVDGRSDDLIVTPQGRRIRLSVVRYGCGILESQIIQTSPDRIVIRVVPSEHFDPASMENVLNAAYDLLGRDMQVSWEVVDSIPRTSWYKFKHVIRTFDA